MIVYNVTVKIELDAHDEWLTWMKDAHIPDVMKTGLFETNTMYKVLVDDQDGITYSIQYSCADLQSLDTYFKEHAPALQQEHTTRYQNKFVAFRTLLESVD